MWFGGGLRLRGDDRVSLVDSTVQQHPSGPHGAGQLDAYAQSANSFPATGLEGVAIGVPPESMS
jgi:hypothetical protein